MSIPLTPGLSHSSPSTNVSILGSVDKRPDGEGTLLLDLTSSVLYRSSLVVRDSLVFLTRSSFPVT